MREESISHSQLWVRFKSTNSPRLRTRLVETYLPLVKGVAKKISSRLPKTVDPEDLASAGACGLLKAIDNYDPARGTRFEAYCRMRVKGSMLDELRNQDWIPREARNREAELSRTQAGLKETLGRDPSDGELAFALNLTVGELRATILKLTFSNIISLHSEEIENCAGSGHNGRNGMPMVEEEPSEIVQRQEITRLIYGSLAQLEKMIIMLYYHEAMTMKEIGEIIDISESRVCQIITRMLMRLKDKFASEY